MSWSCLIADDPLPTSNEREDYTLFLSKVNLEVIMKQVVDAANLAGVGGCARPIESAHEIRELREPRQFGVE